MTSERSDPVPSSLKAISKVIDTFKEEREDLLATISELRSRFSVSEELIGQLRHQLVRKGGRSGRSSKHEGSPGV